MAYKSTNVTTAKQGTVGTFWMAPAGTTLPTDAATALGEAFVNMGHVSEDGVTFSDSKETQEIKNMDGVTVLTVQTGVTSTMNLSLIEGLNPDVLKAAYGDDAVTGTLKTGAAVTVSGAEPEEHVFVFETILRGNVLKRVVIPSGKVTELGDLVYKSDEALAYELTITASADDSGALRYEYMKAPTA